MSCQLHILLFFCLFQLSSRATSQNQVSTMARCSCSNELSEKVIEFKNKSILICGNQKALNKNGKYIVYECQIIDCKNHNILIDHSSDAIFPTILTKSPNRLVIQETQCMLDTTDNIIYVPTTEIIIKFNKGQSTVFPIRKIFSPPILTKRQNDSLNILCRNLESQITGKPSLYPYNEKSLYLLYMGAINGMKKPKYLFQNLDSLFILDGAISETKRELLIVP